MSLLRGGLSERRGAAAIVLGLFVAGGLVFVFAGTLARATELEEQAARARAEVAALEARVVAGRAEVEFLKSDPFLEQQARAVGFGTKAEQRFRLPDDAPSPPVVEALDSGGAEPAPGSPLEAWLELIFGV